MCRIQNFGRHVTCNMACRIDQNGTVPFKFASVTLLLLVSVTHISRLWTLNILSSATCRNRVSTQALWKPWVVQGKPGFLDSLIRKYGSRSEKKTLQAFRKTLPCRKGPGDQTAAFGCKGSGGGRVGIRIGWEQLERRRHSPVTT